MASIEFDHADIDVGGTPVLRDVSLDIDDGEFVAVIGASGSGKTTLLRAVAGFADVVGGVLRIDGADMTGVRVADRDVGMVFQNPVLFENRSVARNVSFPLEIRHEDVDEIRERVGAEMRALHLEHLVGRRPNSLSRGEAQLVQIARTMVRTPKVLLLDEPLASVDQTIARRLRVDLAVLQEGYGVTTIMTTNDPHEAMEMPSRIVVLSAGHVVQVGTPAEVRRSPATLDAAMTTGDFWTIPAKVERGGDGYWLVSGGRSGFRHRAWAPVLADLVGLDVLVGLRAEDVSVHSSGTVTAQVTRLIPGHPMTLFCEVAGRQIGVSAECSHERGDVVTLRVDHCVVFDATTGRALC